MVAFLTSMLKSFFWPIKRYKNEKNYNNRISVFYSNVRSLGAKNKFNNVLSTIVSNNYSIVCLTETWINDGKNYCGEFDIPGYQLYTKNRPYTRGGGGLQYLLKIL